MILDVHIGHWEMCSNSDEKILMTEYQLVQSIQI